LWLPATKKGDFRHLDIMDDAIKQATVLGVAQ
jgi:hypothetical protein